MQHHRFCTGGSGNSTKDNVLIVVDVIDVSALSLQASFDCHGASFKLHDGHSSVSLMQ